MAGSLCFANLETLFSSNDRVFLLLKFRVKHLIACATVIPLSVLAASIFLAGGDPSAQLFFLFVILLVSFVFVEPLNRPNVLRFRGLANLLGGSLPLASLFLPFLFLGNYPWYPLGSGPVSQGVPQLIVVGSILTFFSRLGVLVTVVGLWDGSFFRICPNTKSPIISLFLNLGH